MNEKELNEQLTTATQKQIGQLTMQVTKLQLVIQALEKQIETNSTNSETACNK